MCGEQHVAIVTLHVHSHAGHTYIRTYVPQSEPFKVPQVANVGRQLGNVIVLQVEACESSAVAELFGDDLNVVLAKVQHLQVGQCACCQRAGQGRGRREGQEGGEGGEGEGEKGGRGRGREGREREGEEGRGRGREGRERREGREV